MTYEISLIELVSEQHGVPVDPNKDYKYLSEAFKKKYPTDDFTNRNTNGAKALIGLYRRLCIEGKEYKERAKLSIGKELRIKDLEIRIKYASPSNFEGDNATEHYTNFPRGCAAIAALCWNNGLLSNSGLRSALSYSAGYLKDDGLGCLIVPGIQYLPELISQDKEAIKKFVWQASLALDIANDLKKDDSYSQTAAMIRHHQADENEVQVLDETLFKPSGVKGSEKVKKGIAAAKTKNAAILMKLRGVNTTAGTSS